MMLVASDQWKWKWETNIVHRHSEESSELSQFSSDGAFVGGIPDVHIILTLTCAYVKTLRRPDSTRRHSPSIMIIDWMPITDLVNARNDTETDPRRFRCPAAICIGQIWLLRSFLYRIRKKTNEEQSDDDDSDSEIVNATQSSLVAFKKKRCMCVSMQRWSDTGIYQELTEWNFSTVSIWLALLHFSSVRDSEKTSWHVTTNTIICSKVRLRKRPAGVLYLLGGVFSGAHRWFRCGQE